MAGTVSSRSSPAAVLGRAPDRRTNVDDQDHHEPTRLGRPTSAPPRNGPPYVVVQFNSVGRQGRGVLLKNYGRFKSLMRLKFPNPTYLLWHARA